MQRGELDVEPELKTDKEFQSQSFQERTLASNVSKHKDRQKLNDGAKDKGLSGDAFFETSDNEED